MGPPPISVRRSKPAGAYVIRRRVGNQRGFTLIELLIVVAIVGILASIAVVMYNDMQRRARISRASADVRSMASALTMYTMHMGNLPSAIGLLSLSSSNPEGATSGAFLTGVPTPPIGWSASYSYASSADGTFTVSATGDATTARVP
jgi:general secretion pathway protein G